MDSNWLPRAETTSAGLPVLVQGEVERAVIAAVDLKPEDHPNPSRLKSGRLHLTTHRLVWIDEPSTSAFSIFLSSILSYAPVSRSSLTNLFHTPRVRLELSSESGRRVIIVVFRRRDDLSESFVGMLKEVHMQRSWERRDVGSGEGTSRPSSSGPVVGVAGIIRRVQEGWESTDRSLHEAFQDLNALMSKAKEMVMLAEKMRQSLLSGPSNNAISGSEEEMGTKQEMQDWLLSIGIVSPVTKESAGALYHQQLSRELADFVRVPLERNGGMISLIDVYCLYNRARGTALISPDDLLQACELWEKVDVPVMLRKFESGVMVIQSKNHSDDEVFSRINALVLNPEALRKGISPSDAAITLGIAPALAKEQLLAAESKGFLCRDVSPDGFRFYANIFREIDTRNLYRVSNGVFSMWVSAAS